jgi:hypothetical protein
MSELQTMTSSPEAKIPAHGDLPRGLPAWTYFNNELTELEYERIIRPSWQFACHVNQLKNPGDFATLDMMKDSVIVITAGPTVSTGCSRACRRRRPFPASRRKSWA